MTSEMTSEREKGAHPHAHAHTHTHTQQKTQRSHEQKHKIKRWENVTVEITLMAKQYTEADKQSTLNTTEIHIYREYRQ